MVTHTHGASARIYIHSIKYLNASFAQQGIRNVYNSSQFTLSNRLSFVWDFSRYFYKVTLLTYVYQFLAKSPEIVATGAYELQNTQKFKIKHFNIFIIPFKKKLTFVSYSFISEFQTYLITNYLKRFIIKLSSFKSILLPFVEQILSQINNFRTSISIFFFNCAFFVIICTGNSGSTFPCYESHIQHNATSQRI